MTPPDLAEKLEQIGADFAAIKESAKASEENHLGLFLAALNVALTQLINALAASHRDRATLDDRVAERGATYTPGLDPYRVPIGAATLGYDPRASLTIKAQPPTYVQPPLYTAAQVQERVTERVERLKQEGFAALGLAYAPGVSLTLSLQAEKDRAVSKAVAKAEVKLIREFIADCTGHPIGAGDGDTYIVKTPNIRAWKRRLAEARSRSGEG